MRLIPNSQNILGRKFYDFLWPFPFKGRGRLFRLNDFFIELFNEHIKIEGSKDCLFYFNAGDELHKACPIEGTTRTIFHLNLTLYDSNLEMRDLEQVNFDKHASYWNKMITIGIQ